MSISSITSEAEASMPDPIPASTRYHTPREVAQRLRVSPTTVMRAIHEGRLFAVRVSDRVYRIPVGALARFEDGDESRITVPSVDVSELSEPQTSESAGAELATISR